jgi:hypothetical protein
VHEREEGESDEVRCQIWRGETIRYLAHGGLSVAARENEGQALHDPHFHMPVAHALTVRIRGEREREEGGEQPTRQQEAAAEEGEKKGESIRTAFWLFSHNRNSSTHSGEDST